jgi:NAD(P)-dependent dehydrogenase (short-subunit alcohol dehydrogenase family)
MRCRRTPGAVEQVFADVNARLGPTGIFVNGAAWRARQSFLERGYQDWRRTFAVCVDSYDLCSLAAAQHMIPHQWGRIIHVVSIAGTVDLAPFAPYAAAKGAVHALAKVLAVEMAPFGILVA